MGFLCSSAVKNLPANAGDTGSILRSGRFPGEGLDNPLQHSCLGNPMDWSAWWASFHRVAKSQTCLRDRAYTYIPKYERKRGLFIGNFRVHEILAADVWLKRKVSSKSNSFRKLVKDRKKENIWSFLPSLPKIWWVRWSHWRIAQFRGPFSSP